MFSCLIPLAGRQAVAQRFEAEGTTGSGGAGRVAANRTLAGHPAVPQNEQSGDGYEPDRVIVHAQQSGCT